MPWGWVVMKRVDMNRLKGRIEELEELLAEEQRNLRVERGRFTAEIEARALEAIQAVKEKAYEKVVAE